MKQLFEYIVNLQKTTNEKLSRMEKRQKATVKIVENMDRRLRRVEHDFSYIRRYLSGSDDSDDDDGDDDDHRGGSFVPEEPIYVPTTDQPAPSALHQDEGVRQTSIPEDERVQQSPIEVGQSDIQQEIQDVVLAQGDHQSPNQREEQEQEISGVAAAEAGPDDDQVDII